METSDRPQFNLLLDEQGKLTFRRNGCEDVRDVRLRRAFPWSHPEQFVSIRTAEGAELALIDDMGMLGDEQRRIIEQYLESSVFIPRIEHVEQVDVRFGYQQWRVRTDRGPAEFRVQEREDIRFLPDGRFSVRDADGNIYVLPPRDQLDEASRKAIEPIL